MGDRENHDHCTRKFIELANELKNEGYDAKLVSAALISSSGIFATFVAAGNMGVLEPSGIERVVDVFRANLEHIQKRKLDDMKQHKETDLDEWGW